MEPQSATDNIMTATVSAGHLTTKEVMNNIGKTAEDLRNLLRQIRLPGLNDLLSELSTSTGKKSFLVFRNNKYVNILTENIALFYIKDDSPVIMCFNKEEYVVNYPLDQIQHRLPANQFYRLNRQYLVNFNAIREVESYFGRKLLVNPVVSLKDKLVVSRERVTEFLHWLDNR